VTKLTQNGTFLVYLATGKYNWLMLNRVHSDDIRIIGHNLCVHVVGIGTGRVQGGKTDTVTRYSLTTSLVCLLSLSLPSLCEFYDPSLSFPWFGG